MPQYNYLLIGLGGTGCAVVRELKKKLYLEWRSRGNKGRYPEVYVFEGSHGEAKIESRIATLSVDSNEADLSGQGELAAAWRVFGETLTLRGNERVVISPSGLDGILKSLERYPGVAPWVRDDMEFVGEIIAGSLEPKGCNQIRRMGRLVLANGANIENVINLVADRLQALALNGQIGAEIHIACSFAAGTGSGCVVDVVAQLQKYLRDKPGDHSIFIHGFTTVGDVQSKDVGNFYANQYAALTELNAFRVGLYSPWDIRQTGSNIGGKRLAVPKPQNDGKAAPTGDLKDTFKSVALVTDTTAGGVNVPLPQQIENTAEFIFQIAVRQMGNLPKELRDAITVEDRSPYPTEPQGGDRSTSFIGYGVQRVAIPEREIREKLSYTFAKQFLLKNLYHNWDNIYRNVPRNFAKDSFVGKRRAIWKVTRDHLYLNLVEKITGEPEFETYDGEWRKGLQGEADIIKAQLGNTCEERRHWLAELDQRAEELWGQGFRRRGGSGGVVDYFTIRGQVQEINRRARDIRGIIEEDLLLGFERMEPEYALHHLPEAVGFLKERIEKDRLDFGAQNEEAVVEIEKADRTRDEIRLDYEKCGRWAQRKQERLLGLYLEAAKSFYYWSTIKMATEYGQAFCLKLLEELNLLHEHISVFSTRLKQLNENTSTEITIRIPEDGKIAARDDVEYVVDTKHVNNTILLLEGNKALQDHYSNGTMKELKSVRGDRLEFQAYVDKMPVDSNNRVGGDFADRLYLVSESSAVEAHRKISQDDKQFKGILSQNIIQKLANDHGGNVGNELTQWLRDLLGKAMPMVSFDPNAEAMGLPTDGPVLRRCVFIPGCKDVSPEFQANLRKTIETIGVAGGNCRLIETFVKEVPEDSNPSEITVISVAFFFPVRYTFVGRGLSAKYQAKLPVGAERDKEWMRNYFKFHAESHKPRLPDLMKLPREEVLKEHFAPVMLATAMGLMFIHDEDGQEILFGKVDKFGRVKDAVSSGMKINAKVREAAAESQARFGHIIPIETVTLYSLYLDQFREAGLTQVKELVKKVIEEDGIIDSVGELLEDMTGHCFLLCGKKQGDGKYKLFLDQAKEAAELALALSDKSRF